MRIAVFEFDYHFVQLSTFCKLFEGSGHQVTVFTTEKIYSKIKDDAVNFSSAHFIIKKSESLKKFLGTNLSVINSNDLVFFNTIASGYRTIYNCNFTIPVILRIHNAHSYLQPFKHIHIPKNFYELYKSLSYIVREMIPTLDFYYIPKLIQKFNYICLNDLYREEYVLEKRLIHPDKIFPCFPFTMCDFVNTELKPDTKTLNIVIPGSIDRRRRDYEVVISAIKKALPYLTNPIKIHLLGKPIGSYGADVISKFKQLECDNFKMYSFEGFVSQEEFDKIIVESDFLICPLIVENQFRIYKEIYGKSKSCGGIYDMVTNGKLTIFPTTFFVDKEMKKNIDYYDSSESLSKILTEYANNRAALIKKSEGLIKFLIENYSPKKILHDFEENCKLKLNIKN